MKGKLFLLGVASLFVSLLATLPASLLLPFIPASSPVQLAGVTGSVWKGKAAHLSVQQIPLGKLSWNLHTIAFFTGKLQSDVRIDGDGLMADGLVNIYLDKTLKLEDLQADVDAAWLKNFRQMPAKLAGNFHIDVADAVLEQGKIPLIHGDIDWERGEVISPFPIPSGNYSLKLNSNNNNLIGSISAIGSPFDIKGDISLDQQWQYQAKLKIKANVTGPKMLASNLSNLGKIESDGFVAVEKKGKIPLLF